MTMGRPKMKAQERQNHLIAVRLTRSEYKKVKDIAAAERMSLSNYIRQLLGFRGEK